MSTSLINGLNLLISKLTFAEFPFIPPHLLISIYTLTPTSLIPTQEDFCNVWRLSIHRPSNHRSFGKPTTKKNIYEYWLANIWAYVWLIWSTISVHMSRLGLLLYVAYVFLLTHLFIYFPFHILTHLFIYFYKL